MTVLAPISPISSTKCDLFQSLVVESQEQDMSITPLKSDKSGDSSAMKPSSESFGGISMSTFSQRLHPIAREGSVMHAEHDIFMDLGEEPRRAEEEEIAFGDSNLEVESSESNINTIAME